MKYLLILILLSACGRKGLEERPPVRAPTLDEVRQHYLNLMSTVQDGDGFVDTDRCDSLLHTALLGAGGVHIPNITAARAADGAWFRRPLTYPECLSTHASKSTLSRDMILGLYWYWYEMRDVKNAEAFYKYVLSHDFIIGKSDGSIDGLSRIIITPDMVSQLAELIYRLGGPNHALWRVVATRTSPQLPGFQGHLEMLSTLLWGRLTGYYTGPEIAMIKWQWARLPHNALYAYATNEDAVAAKLLLDQHPADRLPTGADLCDSLPYQRDTIEKCPDDTGVTAPVHFMLLSKWLITQHNLD